MKTAKRQFALNSASGWAAQFIHIIVGLIMLPYVISRLGEQGYGIYQLARSLVVFFMFLQLGMGPTLVRFFSKAIARDSRDDIAKISSTAQLLLGGLGLIATIICIVLIPFFIRFYEIPDESLQQTIFLLICMAVSLFLNMSVIIPKGIIYGSNRYDQSNVVDIIGNLLRLGFILFFLEFIRSSVGLVGLAYLLADLFRYVTYYILAFKKIGKSVLFSVKNVAKTTMRSIFGFSMLNLANSVAQAVAFKGPVFIIGRLLGLEMVTAFAPALLVSSALSGFLGQTTRPLVPFASNDRENKNGSSMGLWAVSMGKITAVLGFCAVLPFAVFGPEIIEFWLGENLIWVWSVIAIMAIGVVISKVQAANYYLALGGGSIKPTVYSQIVMAIVVCIGTYAGISFFGWNLLGIASLIGICIFLRNTFYLAYAYSRQLRYNYNHYLKDVYLMPGLIFIGCLMLGWILKYVASPVNNFLLFLEIFVVIFCYLIICWFIFIKRNTKKKIIDYLFSTIKYKHCGVN